MSDTAPVIANRYWETLHPQDLAKYDASLDLIRLLIGEVNRLESFKKTPGGKLTPILISAAEGRQGQYSHLIGTLMPDPWTFDNTISPEDVAHAAREHRAREFEAKGPGIPPEEE